MGICVLGIIGCILFVPSAQKCCAWDDTYLSVFAELESTERGHYLRERFERNLAAWKNGEDYNKAREMVESGANAMFGGIRHEFADFNPRKRGRHQEQAGQRQPCEPAKRQDVIYETHCELLILIKGRPRKPTGAASSASTNRTGLSASLDRMKLNVPT